MPAATSLFSVLRHEACNVLGDEHFRAGFAPERLEMQPVSTMFVSGNQAVASIAAANIRTAANVPVYVSSAGMNSNVMNFTVQ